MANVAARHHRCAALCFAENTWLQCSALLCSAARLGHLLHCRERRGCAAGTIARVLAACWAVHFHVAAIHRPPACRCSPLPPAQASGGLPQGRGGLGPADAVPRPALEERQPDGDRGAAGRGLAKGGGRGVRQVSAREPGGCGFGVLWRGLGDMLAAVGVSAALTPEAARLGRWCAYVIAQPETSKHRWVRRPLSASLHPLPFHRCPHPPTPAGTTCPWALGWRT